MFQHLRMDMLALLSSSLGGFGLAKGFQTHHGLLNLTLDVLFGDFHFRSGRLLVAFFLAVCFDRLLFYSLALFLFLFVLFCRVSLRLRLFCLGFLYRKINFTHDFGSLKFFHPGFNMLNHFFGCANFLFCLFRSRLCLFVSGGFCITSSLYRLGNCLHDFMFLTFRSIIGNILCLILFAGFFAFFVQAIQVNFANGNNITGDVFDFSFNVLDFFGSFGAFLFCGFLDNRLLLFLAGRCLLGRRFFLGFDINLANDFGLYRFYMNVDRLMLNDIGLFNEYVISVRIFFLNRLFSHRSFSDFFLFLEGADFNLLSFLFDEFFPLEFLKENVVHLWSQFSVGTLNNVKIFLFQQSCNRADGDIEFAGCLA